MTYFEFMESIEHLSKKDSFTRNDMLDIIDYISLNLGFAMEFLEADDTDYAVSSTYIKSIFYDLIIRFGPRPDDE